VSAAALLLRALVTRYARSHALRAAVTLAAVAVGVASAYAIDLANVTAVGSFASSVNVIANRINVQILGNGEGFDERTLTRVERLPGVRSASPVVIGELVLPNGRDAIDGEIVRVLGIDITRGAAPPGVNDARGTSSHFDLHRFLDERAVVISDRISRAYRAPEGGILQAFAGPRSVALPVAAVIPPNTAGVDSSVAFTDVSTAQTLFGSVGRLDRIDIAADPSEVARVRAEIDGVLPPGARTATPKTRLDEIGSMLASFTMNLTALADVALLVGMYLIYNAVAISVVQRAADIGTFRALGARRLQIFWTFVAEGAIYGVLGSLAGIALGALLARFSVAAVQTTVSSLYFGSHSDAVAFNWPSTLRAFFLGTGLAMTAAAIPAAGAASTPPARTMRNTGSAEPRVRGFTQGTAIAGFVLLLLAYGATRMPALGAGVPVFGYLAAILAIAGASLETPLVLACAAIPLQRLARGAEITIGAAFLRASPRRLSVAIASLTVAVAMTIAVAILVGSFRSTIVAWTNDTLSADLYVGSRGAADASPHGNFTVASARRIARIPGVGAVDTIRELDVTIDGRPAQLGAIDFASLASRNKLRFLGNVDLRQLAARMRGGDDAAISVPFATHFALGTGDAFWLDTPSGRTRMHVAAVYNDYSTNGGTFFIDQSTFARLYNDPTFDSIAVYLAPGAKLPSVRSAIERALAPLQIDVTSNVELRAYALQVFDRTFAITSALYTVSIAIAVLGVISTLFALVLERRIDLALLRYAGLQRRGVVGVVFVQALVVGVLSGALGIVLGVLLAYDLIYVINKQSFGWLIEWNSPGWFYLLAFGMVVVAALVAAIYPALVASRIRPSEVLRVE
jgi:putative ABC transport system permease protein